MVHDYYEIRKYERLIVKIVLGRDPETMKDVQRYGSASVLIKVFENLPGDDRETFVMALGNAIEKNASAKALSRMVLFVSTQQMQLHHSIDILADWFIKNKKSDPRVYEALDAYWRRKFNRALDAS